MVAIKVREDITMTRIWLHGLFAARGLVTVISQRILRNFAPVMDTSRLHDRRPVVLNRLELENGAQA
ncbi:hypothetical protein AUC45_13255 [Erythrobacter sp. YT30]|nr:hypothetical protein AUC45_13255 [Erythrobacter sp. YT30]